MKTRVKWLSLALILLFSNVASAQKSDFDFRRTNWGMTKAKVKAVESADLHFNEPEELYYKTTVGTLTAIIQYKFIQTKLVRAFYLFRERHTNKNDFIHDYENIKEILTKEYGAPIVDNTIWHKDLYKDSRQEWGFAVNLGHLVFETKWETQKTIIAHSLRGQNYKINHGISYKSKKLAYLIEKRKDEKDQDNY